jgi:citrate lyase subunit beta / citryl-CoA lyase
MHHRSPGPAWLFCPADRPDRYHKALNVADVVILDLEDAVSPSKRSGARDALRRFAGDGRVDFDRIVVRINGAETRDHIEDLTVVAEIGIRRVMVSKCEVPASVAAISHEVIALVETPRGLEEVGALAAEPNVVAIMWGADDLVAGMGGTASRHRNGTYRDVARYARSRALVAAKAHGRLALDGVRPDSLDATSLWNGWNGSTAPTEE